MFQGTMLRSADEHERLRIEEGAPWAKSGGSARPRHERKAFRHELASALDLLGAGGTVLDGFPERDLVIYLVAAHHGRIRLGIRSVPGDEGAVLGIVDGDEMPAVEVPGSRVPGATLSLAPVRLGRSDGGQPSWTEMALGLRDRADLGPFRLAFLEAVVRLADWRASSAAGAQQ